MQKVITHILLIIFLITSLTEISCKSKEYEFIAYNDENKIILLNLDGEIKNEITLPRNIKNEFCVNGHKVSYLSNEGDIYVYDWIEKKEEKATYGPYVYKEKYDGEHLIYRGEYYSDIFLNSEGNKIIFSIGPENFIEDNDMEFIEIGLIDIRDKKFRRITNDGFMNYNPISYKNWIIYETGGAGIMINDIKNNQKLLLNNLYDENYNSQRSFLGLVRMLKNELIFAQFNNNAIINRLISYNMNSKKFKILKNIKSNLNVSIIGLVSISSDLKYLLKREKETISIMDLMDLEITKHLKITNENADVDFLSLTHTEYQFLPISRQK